MDIAPDPPQKRKRLVNLTTPIDVAAYWNDNNVPPLNKIALIKFGRTLELDQTKSDAEKYRLLQAQILVIESMSGDRS